MSKKFQIIIIVILSLIVVFGIFAIRHQGNQIDDLKQKKQEIKVPDKSYVTDKTSQEDVKKYQGKVEDKLNRFLRNDLKEGVFNYDNSGVNSIRTLFSPTGISPVTEKQSQKEFVKHYSKFDYDIKNTFIDKGVDGSANVYCQIDTEYKGHKINDNYNLIMLHFDEDGQVTGGKLYAEE